MEEKEFGEVLLDVNAEDITAPWRKMFEDLDVVNDDYFERFCWYWTLLNNYYYEEGIDYKNESKVGGVISLWGYYSVILYRVARDYPNEKIIDVKPFVEHARAFLIDNLDFFLNSKKIDKFTLAVDKFMVHLENVIYG